jgi:hypothetical protein
VLHAGHYRHYDLTRPLAHPNQYPALKAYREDMGNAEDKMRTRAGKVGCAGHCTALHSTALLCTALHRTASHRSAPLDCTVLQYRVDAAPICAAPSISFIVAIAAIGFLASDFRPPMQDCYSKDFALLHSIKLRPAYAELARTIT